MLIMFLCEMCVAIKHVYTTLVKIANTKGPGSQDAKQRMVEKLLVMAEGPEEARYLARTFVQNVSFLVFRFFFLFCILYFYFFYGDGSPHG